MKINLKPFLFWIVPVWICFLFELLFADFRWYNFQNLVEHFVYLSCIWLALSMIKIQKAKAILTSLAFTFFIYGLWFETSFFYLFSTYFSASSIFIFFETNTAEISEFLNLYVDIKLLILSGLLLVILISYFIKIKKPALVLSKNFPFSLKIGLIIIFVVGLKWSGYIVANFPFQVLKGTLSYVYETYKFSDLNLDQRFGHFEKVTFKGNTESHTFVLLIGESTTRRQMGIYGYERETTPLLSKMKEELLIYNDVISSESHTIESLEDALIFKDFQNKTESSIIQLMNQAGFKTFWLSNQMPIGMYETFLTKVSKASDHYIYTNTTRWGSVTPFDEVLLPHLDKALEDEASKKFIVINFLATHSNYNLRYPDQFKKFQDNPKTPFPSKENFELINHYNNSIVYLDFLIHSIIEKVKAKDDKSYVLYFSDHGEEVFFEREFVGHVSSDIPTKSMFEIPFFLWTSPEFDSDYNFEFKPDRPYSLSSFIHSLSDLSQIDFSKLETQKSIFSEDFKPKKRLISNGIDFDLYFERQKDSMN
ncbi:sulfatase-like hydrolase/transferase [Psychroflexus montanilacus]|uniref:sulfatase-like hydrolase/transferase n=1 Tax=Psychroflexus montanilacus TaxID=2873598 RepID=UPI001CCD1295|nr:sulfatase-like hydrolase/transferase [Psychroflexus montanilacus]MBZ9650806.1 sulfatase-like hydrolase/transferase [Psychroflexus montanilacus]